MPPVGKCEKTEQSGIEKEGDKCRQHKFAMLVTAPNMKFDVRPGGSGANPKCLSSTSQTCRTSDREETPILVATLVLAGRNWSKDRFNMKTGAY